MGLGVQSVPKSDIVSLELETIHLGSAQTILLCHSGTGILEALEPHAAALRALRTGCDEMRL